MPVEFLTAAQEARYGCYTGDPTPEHLARCFYFDDLDQALILARRTSVTRLGFAVQLETIRFLGTFLTNPGAVPLVVITTITAQLGLPADTDLALYQSPDTWWDHQALIRQHYGYQDMLTLPVLIPLLRWLYSRAWTHAERPSVLFDLTTAWLVERKIVLPGVTVVARLVARVRDRVNARLWQSLAHLPTPTQHTQLGLKPSISQPNALALRFLIFAFILLMRIGIIIKSAPLFLIRMPWNSALGDRKMRNYHQTCVFLMLVRLDVGILGLPLLLVRNSR